MDNPVASSSSPCRAQKAHPWLLLLLRSSSSFNQRCCFFFLTLRLLLLLVEAPTAPQLLPHRSNASLMPVYAPLLLPMFSSSPRRRTATAMVATAAAVPARSAVPHQRRQPWLPLRLFSSSCVCFYFFFVFVVLRSSFGRGSDRFVYNQSSSLIHLRYTTDTLVIVIRNMKHEYEKMKS
ncbi:uncharacterized protein LOC142180637 [Nicotiana tabacum]|uniref:Uncharacterized protein LOC142180637 n=1 Tax=Nicotiana tabacum TaxID=4097 RepID=A0AC58UH39_TOBAC